MSTVPQNPRVQHPDYYSGDRRFGGGHIKPPNTPGNPSPISKAADLKIYHTGGSRFSNAYERSLWTSYGAMGHAVTSNAHQSEQTQSSASAARTTYRRLQDVAALSHAFERTGGKKAIAAVDHKLGLIDNQWKKEHRPEIKAHRAEIREIKSGKKETGSLTKSDKRELKQRRRELKTAKRGLDSKGVKKSIHKAEKLQRKGGTLSQKDKKTIARLKTRQKYQEKRDKITKVKSARAQLKRSLAGAAGDALRKSDMSGAQTLSSAVNIARNPYVHKVLKTAKRGAVGAHRIVRKVGKPVDKLVVKGAKKLDKKLTDGKLTKKVDRLKQRKKTKRLNKANRKELKRVKKQLKKEKRWTYRFSRWFQKTKVGGVLGRIGNFFKAIGGAFSTAKAFLKKILIWVGGIFLAIALVISIINGIVTVVSNLMVTLGLMDDGRINLGDDWVWQYNSIQSEIIDEIDYYKSLKGKEYNGKTVDKVYVNYLGSGGSSNFEEVIAMTGVRFGMDFEQDGGVYSAAAKYATVLWDATNLISMSESDLHYCDGCVTRTYRCTDPVSVLGTDEPPATDERQALISKADHSGEANVSPSAYKGCVATTFSCMTYGHSMYNANGCFLHNDGKPFVTLGPTESCDNYENVSSYSGAQKQCLGHCDGKHIDYKCPGNHTEKVCPGHIDLVVNVTCMGFDEIFDYDPVEYLFVDLGDYEKGEEIGVFEITYYCTEKYSHICNDGNFSTTASGTTPTPGRTIAVDPDVIPLGSKVIIDGHVYTAEDTGGAIKGNRIDIAVSSHEDAVNLGVKDAKVYWAVESTGDAEPEVEVENDSFHTRANIDYKQYANNSTSGLWHYTSGYGQYEGKCASYEKTSKGCSCPDDWICAEAASLLYYAKFKLDPDTVKKIVGDEYFLYPSQSPMMHNDDVVLNLQEIDKINTTDIYTSVEWNVLQYIQWPVEDLQAKAREIKPDYELPALSGLSESYYLLWNIIIPWEVEQWEANKNDQNAQLYLPEFGKEVEVNPGETVPTTPGGTTSVGEIDFTEYSFAGWTEGNREWAKSVAENITSDYYRGLEKVKRTDAPEYEGYSFEGLEITGCQIPIKYYSQRDSRWANKPILPAYPEQTIRAAGCGFSSMSIVVSSLTDKTYDPPAMCAMYPNYYMPGAGAYHSLIARVSQDFGLTCEEIHSSNMQKAMDALSEGKLVVVLVGKGGRGWTGNGYYKGNGHFLVICGVSEDGDLYLADPWRPDMINSDGSPKPVGFSHFVASGISKFWIIGK